MLNKLETGSLQTVCHAEMFRQFLRCPRITKGNKVWEELMHPSNNGNIAGPLRLNSIAALASDIEKRFAILSYTKSFLTRKRLWLSCLMKMDLILDIIRSVVFSSMKIMLQKILCGVAINLVVNVLSTQVGDETRQCQTSDCFQQTRVGGMMLLVTISGGSPRRLKLIMIGHMGGWVVCLVHISH